MAASVLCGRRKTFGLSPGGLPPILDLGAAHATDSMITPLEHSFATARSQRGLLALLFLLLYLAQPGLALVRVSEKDACGSSGDTSCCCSDASALGENPVEASSGCCSESEDESPRLEVPASEPCDCVLESTPIPALDPFLLPESQDGGAAKSYANWLIEHASRSAEIPRSPLEGGGRHGSWRVPLGDAIPRARGSKPARAPRIGALHDGGLPEWLALHQIARL